MQTRVEKDRFYNPALLLFYRYIARKLPAAWFRPALPNLGPLNFTDRKLRLEIASHCWQYSHLLAYQLSSYVLNPPQTADLTVTVFYSPEDQATAETLEFFGEISVECVTWNWQPIEKELLFRRAIGRNQVAFNTHADWVWYADCDLIFAEGVIDHVVTELKTQTGALVFPGYEMITELLPQGHALLRENSQPEVVGVQPEHFKRREINRAVGAFQIVRGDVLRSAGYCDSIPLFQTPSERWLKTYEDTVFRWLIGTEGERLNSGGSLRIRHQEKGRYSGSKFSLIRKQLRAAQKYS